MRALVRAHAAEEDEVVAARAYAGTGTWRGRARSGSSRSTEDARFGFRWFIEIEMSFAFGASPSDLLVHAARLSVEGPVHRVAERRVDEPAEREPEHPRVVVQDVELVGLEERVHGVLHLPVRVPDPLARRGVEDRLEASAGLRVARGEERDVVARVDEAVGQQRDDALGPAVRLRRHREPDGADESDCIIRLRQS